MTTAITASFGLALAATFATAPALANPSRREVQQLCEGTLSVNRTHNISLAPGSTGSRIIMRQQGMTAGQYSMIWGYAKRSGIPACAAMW